MTYRFSSQFIDGRWCEGTSGKQAANTNPFTGEAIMSISLASTADVDAAYEAAAKAQKAWAATGPTRRAQVFQRAAAILVERKDEIIDWLIRESGSTRIKAGIEWQAVAGGLAEAAAIPFRAEGRIIPIDLPETESRAYRKPIGVVGVISPWNFPLHLSHRSIAPALALGNAVVVKPAEDTPVTGGLLLARIYEEAGLPAGLLNVVCGDAADIGDHFCLHDVPRFLSFTGSTAVGRRIGRHAVEARIIKRVALELGGNNPLVVLADADLQQAAQAAAFGRFLHQGQICMSTNRIIVEDAVYEPFIEHFVAAASKLAYGDPDLPGTLLGPAVNARQFAANMRHLEDAKGRLRTVLSGKVEGQVIPPHIFADVDNDDPLAQAELFCPMAMVIKARDAMHALDLANATDSGLSSAVFAGDEQRALAFAQALDVGMTHINDMTVADMPYNPFGGEKNSGLGRFGGDWIIDELTTTHWITIRRGPVDYIS